MSKFTGLTEIEATRGGRLETFMRVGLLVVLACLTFSPSALADRLFTVEVISKGEPVVGTTVCLGTEELPAAFGGAVTDEEGRAVLLFPNRGQKMEIVSELVMRVTRPDGDGVIARIAARTQESPDPEIVSMRTGLPVTCGRRLPVPATDLLSDKERGALQERGVKLEGIRVIPSLADQRRHSIVYDRMLEAAIKAEGDALERLRDGGKIEVLGRDERCFGAVGNGCGWGDTGEFAFCDIFGRCHVNSGSWLHDECCAANPNGAWCGGDNSEPQTCKAELDRGWDRMALAPWTWVLDVDYDRVNRSGRVERDLYCAPDGQVLPAEDGNFCCENYRELEGIEWALVKYESLSVATITDMELIRCDADGDIVAIIAD